MPESSGAALAPRSLGAGRLHRGSRGRRGAAAMAAAEETQPGSYGEFRLKLLLCSPCLRRAVTAARLVPRAAWGQGLSSAEVSLRQLPPAPSPSPCTETRGAERGTSTGQLAPMAPSAKDRGSGLQHRYTLLASAGRLESFGKENKAFKNTMWRGSTEIQDARLQESRIQLKKTKPS